jgi:hypothetical protein
MKKGCRMVALYFCRMVDFIVINIKPFLVEINF